MVLYGTEGSFRLRIVFQKRGITDGITGKGADKVLRQDACTRSSVDDPAGVRAECSGDRGGMYVYDMEVGEIKEV